jgi:uncharacterized protein
VDISLNFAGMKKLLMSQLLLLSLLLLMPGCNAQRPPARFHALVLYENGGHHIQYSVAAKVWLDRLAADSNFTIHYITNTDSINEESLKDYQLFVQLDYPPYGWKDRAVKAFEKYIEKGKGGWIGFHHASLLGEFDGFSIWPWFHEFMGSIRFKDYIPGFADGKVNVEDSLHPCMKGVPRSFIIQKEEWYTYDRSPRTNVRVIASVDESTYKPDSPVKMGDHPVIWTNPKMAAKNIYIFMGHSPDLFNDRNYTRIFRNAIFWAAAK